MNHQSKLRWNTHARLAAKRRAAWKTYSSMYGDEYASTTDWPNANEGPFYDFYSGGELISQAAHAKRMFSRDDSE